jgi:hypothetical protein
MHRICGTHFICGLESRANLNQVPSPDAGTILSSRLPILAMFDEFRPKRKQPALHRLYGVNGTSAFTKEVALRSLRLL